MRIRVSIGNIAPRITIEGEKDSRTFGILNKGALKRGVHQVNPVGGAALMTEAGKKYLERMFGAEFQEDVGNGMDARFFMDDGWLVEVFKLFEQRRREFYEIDPLREIADELTERDLPNQRQPVLTLEEAAELRVTYRKTVRQVPQQNPTSALEIAGTPTRRLFNLYDITAPQSVFERILTSPVIEFISPEQAEKAQAGIPQETMKGWRVGDNFIQ